MNIVKSVLRALKFGGSNGITGKEVLKGVVDHLNSHAVPVTENFLRYNVATELEKLNRSGLVEKLEKEKPKKGEEKILFRLTRAGLNECAKHKV